MRFLFSFFLFLFSPLCHEAPAQEGAGLYAPILPNAVVHPIPGACHDTWVTHTEEFYSRATAFLEQWK